ncbi:phosphatidylinositol-binding protein scs2 [Coemansia interrupta]|uniref:Phosphatidylinositol-binding protein scs2 n=1 Tax=Coemansia interrupta TaxID=1126814 RepID=A0A9W8H677_9FUNG|nr:phosphatidylinositol-binding protein scs2 [Coemansia interrupta]
MALVYEPGDSLSFRQPFTSLTQDQLRLTNKNNTPVAFKVKTTAPKQYCVRPNAGRIEPGQSVEVQIVLQPMKEDPPVNAKCRDKFLVQSIAITREMDTMTISEIWTMAEGEAKDIINEKKLRVKYLAPESSAQQQQQQPANVPADNASANSTSVRSNPPTRPLPGPSPLARTVDTTVESPGEEEAVHSASIGESPKPVDAIRSPQSANSARLFPESSVAASPADTTVHAEDSLPSYSTDKSNSADLEKAQLKIADLQRQVDEYKYQLEHTTAASEAGASSSSRSVSVQPSKAVDGLSIQSVAIVALVAFMTGYFFF